MPLMLHFLSKQTCMNLPKRDELSFRTVLALPKASRMTLHSRICCSTQFEAEEVTVHRYCRMNLVVSVLPAPDSPEITHDWFMSEVCTFMYAACEVANTCGGSSPIRRPLYIRIVSSSYMGRCL